MAVRQICIILATLVQPELIIFAPKAVSVRIWCCFTTVWSYQIRTSKRRGRLVQRTEISKPSH